MTQQRPGQLTAEVLVVGIGGQGVMTAAEVIARAGIEAGFDVTKTEVTGMSQRGGVVCSQVRIGTHIDSSEIRPGTATLLIAFEAAEGLRWSHYLARDGRLLVDSWRAVPPVVSSGVYTYPDDPAADLRATNCRVQVIDARATAESIGDPRLANSVMLGAAAASLPFPQETLRAQVMRRFGAEAMARSNGAAFDAGRTVASAESVCGRDHRASQPAIRS